MHEKIIQFLESQSSASICGVGTDGMPYCFSCFFAFDPKSFLFYFKSSADAWHSKMMQVNPRIAGTVLPDTLSRLAVKGIQFNGTLLQEDETLNRHAARLYYKKFPVARAIPGRLWAIQPEHIRFTDSTMGFGKKLIYSRPQDMERRA